MGQTLTGLLTSVRAIAGRPGTPPRARPGGGPDPELLAALRHCGDHLADLAASGPLTDARRTRLIASIGALTTACSTPGADAFDALLRTGQQALDSGGDAGARLALALADEATVLRARSKGAWRLRGNALDALGRSEEAITAYERHLALQQNAAASRDVERRIATLRAAGDRIDEALALVGGGEGATGAGVDAGAVRLSRHLPAADALAAFTELVRLRTAERGAADPAVRRLAALYAEHRRLADRDPMADPLLGGAEPIGVPGLRRFLAGRTVCLVADTPHTAEQEQRPGSSLAALIGGYDLVVRCDAVRHAAPTARTDLHAVTLRGDSPWKGPRWDRRATARLVFGDPLPHWRLALRSRLVPGAQDRVGDATLRRPLHDPALLAETADADEPASTAFTVLRLLDFLGTPARVDLIGFEGPAALPPREREWIGARTGRTDDTAVRITLR
ncbi:tetratricopeptide repeat protein [Streptomyces sp. MBT67]|uniref:tetratricopeptide repeat protein n=1 Tax=unclassified Streptomyces TaxID=2593676 RepID=UPI00190ACA0B|nr:MULTISPECIES: tetratricopeptide repeat protein [unclassified Streptomyces]MBK3532427.1 tetratricopeptide repeat protein [Streptomyces sp. MBT72]MBK3538233.1 tetratricopeptide repeat protein [Streptomyces sp. MBT67]MBK3551796.1 tetratricopeptide repeat protein [Streptomyces sp. MBT61]MBK6030232.1 tetratricopeptide repeat protein [Streptomyces sp. MBT59]